MKTLSKIDWLMIGLALLAVTALLVLALAEPPVPDGLELQLATRTLTAAAEPGWWDVLPTPPTAASTATLQPTPEAVP